MHWLVRPDTIRKLWWLFIGILALTVIAGFLVDMHPHFAVENTPGFFAWFGFITCVAMVFFSKLVGVFLKRSDTHYER
jgi:hypothetical protein